MNAKNIALVLLNIMIAGALVLGAYKFWNAYQDERIYQEKKEGKEEGGEYKEEKKVCAQVLSYGKNPSTGACGTFPTPCDVPLGWSTCTPEEKSDGGVTEEQKDETETPVKEEVVTPPAPEPVKEEVKEETVSEEDGKIYLYYFKGEMDNDCSATVKLERVLDERYGTEEVAALVTLTKALTEEEKALGYFSELPSGTRLRKLSITKGVATADFNESLNSGGGSCSMTARRAQIEKTLLQFPDIKEVIITVNGNATTALQP